MKVLTTAVLPRLDDITENRKKVQTLEGKFVERTQQDDFMFARLSEDADHAKNLKREDRVVVVGMKVSSYPKTTGERKDYLTVRLRPLIEKILGEVVFDIYVKRDPIQGVLPPFEIRFPNRSDCMKFKRDAHKLVKDDFPDLSELNFFPCLTPASRIRVEVLRAISRKLTTDALSGYCPIYGTRPILQTGPLVNGRVQPTDTFTYVDAVQRFRHLININDLSFAYKRLGNSFMGALRQTFVVLNEDDSKQYQNQDHDSRQNQRGNKRRHEDPPTQGSSRGRGKRAE